MTDHAPRTFRRHCDVAIVGGSAAGSAAALQLGRQRRSVIVVDDGAPRNAPAAAVHGYLGHEGTAPARLAALARDEVRSYGGEVLSGRAVEVRRTTDDRFEVELTGGHRVIARRVVVASGILDELPDVPGVAEHWGGGVFSCPFCHGYEVRDRRVVQLVVHPAALHAAVLLRQLTDRLTVVLHGGALPNDPDVVALSAAGVAVVDARALRLVEGPSGRVAAVELDDGRRIDADAVAVGARFRPRIAPFATLGLSVVEHASGLGEHVVTDASGQTTAPGVYAAGNAVDPSLQVSGAAAAGAWVGATVAADLAREDLVAASRPSARQAEWDERYGGDPVWSGNPNGALVAEVGGSAPGRVLDVGAGEGGDAIWLAEQGWEVTATDISPHALDRVATEASRRGLSIVCRRRDATSLDPFEPGAFDLVTAHYASIPRTADGRAEANLLDAVAPGGALLFVTHDLGPMRAPSDPATHSRAFDPDAYLRADDVVRAIEGRPGWEIEVHEIRTRPPGSATASHHVDDVVLRERRSREL